MGCDVVQITLEDGTVGHAIVCRRGQRRQTCSVGLCGKDSVALCDYPVERKGKKATCDSPMCAQHRHPVPAKEDTDWCDGHWNHAQRGLFANDAPHRGGYAAEEQE